MTDTSKFTTEDCSECEGAGYIYWFTDEFAPGVGHYTNDHSVVCDYCDGVGEITVEED